MFLQISTVRLIALLVISVGLNSVFLSAQTRTISTLICGRDVKEQWGGEFVNDDSLGASECFRKNITCGVSGAEVTAGELRDNKFIAFNTLLTQSRRKLSEAITAKDKQVARDEVKFYERHVARENTLCSRYVNIVITPEVVSIATPVILLPTPATLTPAPQPTATFTHTVIPSATFTPTTTTTFTFSPTFSPTVTPTSTVTATPTITPTPTPNFVLNLYPTSVPEITPGPVYAGYVQVVTPYSTVSTTPTLSTTPTSTPITSPFPTFSPSPSPTPGYTVTFSIIGDPSGAYALSGSTLQLKSGISIDYESFPTTSLIISATDDNGLNLTGTFIVNTRNLAEFINVSSPPLNYTGNSISSAWGDFDGDGDLDVYITDGGSANQLIRNNGNVFSILGSAPLADTGYASGAAWGDYDNDGDLDLFLANASATQSKLFRNNGNATFTDVSVAAGLNFASITIGSAWGDYDNDGDLDLFVANDGVANALYQNTSGTFVNVAASVGVADSQNARSVSWVDYDNDYDLDLYVTNYGQPNLLYRNDGGTFTSITSVLNDAGSGIAATWGDYDNDGDFDLYLVNYGQSNKLYRNDGGGNFTNVTSSPLDSIQNGTSAAWGDYDGDGDLDIYLGAYNEPGKLFRYDGGMVFTEVVLPNVSNVSNTSGVNLLDVDGDCDLDIYRSNGTQANTLYLNDLNPSPNTTFKVEILNTGGARTTAGTKVELWDGGIRVATRLVGNAGGLYSQDFGPVVFNNLIPSINYQLRVYWSDAMVVYNLGTPDGSVLKRVQKGVGVL
jgi:hypothetical protein